MAISLLKKLKDLRQNPQNRKYGEKSNSIYETYKNTVMPHGRNIYAKTYDISKSHNVCISTVRSCITTL